LDLTRSKRKGFMVEDYVFEDRIHGFEIHL